MGCIHNYCLSGTGIPLNMGTSFMGVCTNLKALIHVGNVGIRFQFTVCPSALNAAASKQISCKIFSSPRGCLGVLIPTALNSVTCRQP